MEHNFFLALKFLLIELQNSDKDNNEDNFAIATAAAANGDNYMLVLKMVNIQ